MAVYFFQKAVLPAKLVGELNLALGAGVVAYINTAVGPPPTGEIHTSRDLAPEEFTTGMQVLQAHDASTLEGMGAVYKVLRANALPLVGVQFTALTLAQLKVVLACVAVKAGFIDANGAVQLPDAE